MSTVIRVVREVDGITHAASWGTVVDGLIVTQQQLEEVSRQLLDSYAHHDAVLECKSENELIYRVGRERYWFEIDLNHPVTIRNREFYGVD